MDVGKWAGVEYPGLGTSGSFPSVFYLWVWLCAVFDSFHLPYHRAEWNISFLSFCFGQWRRWRVSVFTTESELVASIGVLSTVGSGMVATGEEDEIFLILKGYSYCSPLLSPLILSP